MLIFRSRGSFGLRGIIARTKTAISIAMPARIGARNFMVFAVVFSTVFIVVVFSLSVG